MSLSRGDSDVPTSPRAWLRVFKKGLHQIVGWDVQARDERADYSPLVNSRKMRNAASPACFASCGVEGWPS
jgi:hypothetical protein